MATTRRIIQAKQNDQEVEVRVGDGSVVRLTVIRNKGNGVGSYYGLETADKDGGPWTTRAHGPISK